MSDYERIARMIRHLDSFHQDQPGLDELAAVAGLSRFHLHRLFVNWAGITPKDFLQSLTATELRARLRSGERVLEASLECGLSSPSRAHDLCLALEAATPGEIRSGGAGWTIDCGLVPSPFGPCLLANGPRGICHLQFPDSPTPDGLRQSIQKAWPQATLRWDYERVAPLGERIFRTAEPGSPVRAYVQGTPFQIRVWRALLLIPPGLLATYGTIARLTGHPRAFRAVGTAVGNNPLAILVPCHRVIRETGIIGNYRWGTDRKKALLAWESGTSSQTTPTSPVSPINVMSKTHLITTVVKPVKLR